MRWSSATLVQILRLLTSALPLASCSVLTWLHGDKRRVWTAVGKSHIPGGLTQLWQPSCKTSVISALSGRNVTVNARTVDSGTHRISACPSTAAKWMLTNADMLRRTRLHTLSLCLFKADVITSQLIHLALLQSSTLSCHCWSTPISLATKKTQNYWIINKMLFSFLLHSCWHPKFILITVCYFNIAWSLYGGRYRGGRFCDIQGCKVIISLIFLKIIMM